MIDVLFELKHRLDKYHKNHDMIELNPPINITLNFSEHPWLFIYLLIPRLSDYYGLQETIQLPYQPIRKDSVLKGLEIYKRYAKTKDARIILIGFDIYDAYELIKTKLPDAFGSDHIPDIYPSQGFIVKGFHHVEKIKDLIAHMDCHMFSIYHTSIKEYFYGATTSGMRSDGRISSEYHVLNTIKDITPYEFAAVKLLTHAKKETREMILPYINSKWFKTTLEDLFKGRHSRHAFKRHMDDIETHINDKNISAMSKMSYDVIKVILYQRKESR